MNEHFQSALAWRGTRRITATELRVASRQVTTQNSVDGFVEERMFSCAGGGVGPEENNKQ